MWNRAQESGPKAPCGPNQFIPSQANGSERIGIRKRANQADFMGWLVALKVALHAISTPVKG